MENLNFNNTPKFKSPEEELIFLRAQLAEREKTLIEKNKEVSKEALAHEVIKEYKQYEPKEVLDKKTVLSEKKAEALVLRLKPESHDSKMEELLGLLLDKGVINTISVVAKMDNPHVYDDFHRFLVQYLYSTNNVPGLKEGTPLFQSLNMTLFEITLPSPKDASAQKSLRELLSTMEQFYSGMQSIGEGKDNKDRRHFTLEIAMAADSDVVIFYASVPKDKAELFEKQLLGVQADARIIEAPDDYNIFFENGETSGSFAKFSSYEVFPIKTYDSIEYDPMNLIINTFNKMQKDGEGAAIQFVICPLDKYVIDRYKDVLKKVEKGEPLKSVLDDFEQVKKEVLSFAKGFFSSSNKEKKEEEKKVDQKEISNIEEKIGSPIMATNIRIIVSAPTKERSKQILGDIESSFNQFSEIGKNGFEFKRIEGRDLSNLVHSFVYRELDEKNYMNLNLKELSTVFHFPYGITSPNLKEARATEAPVISSSMDKNGILLGYNKYRGQKTEVYMSSEDRMRHMYVIGQTGTGKTTLLKNMIAQDIRSGKGCCFIDPHGSDIQHILSYVPKERIDDVIYFDPGYTARPMGLNMLEYDRERPEQKTLVVNELMNIFYKLFDRATMGAMFEQYFKNSAFLAMEDPENHPTLLDITRILADKNYRDSLLAKCKSPIIREFWRSAEQTSGEQGLENFVPYISSKFDNFISNDFMRPVVLQEKSAFNIREIMDQGKIFIVNLSKGKLGDLNSNLIGLVLVNKIQMAAMSRVDMAGQKMNDFYLYLDEFQNITTDSIASILSEARKYRLSLTVAHQYISQLEDNIKNAVFGNVGSMAIYRISTEDAAFVEQQFKPVFDADDIVKLDNFNCYMKMLISGQPTKPFNMESHYSMTPLGDMETVEKIKQLSYLKYGRPREEVEEEIMDRFNKSN